MARGREFQIVGAAAAKLREPKHVRTWGTNNNLDQYIIYYTKVKKKTNIRRNGWTNEWLTRQSGTGLDQRSYSKLGPVTSVTGDCPFIGAWEQGKPSWYRYGKQPPRSTYIFFPPHVGKMSN